MTLIKLNTTHNMYVYFYPHQYVQPIISLNILVWVEINIYIKSCINLYLSHLSFTYFTLILIVNLTQNFLQCKYRLGWACKKYRYKAGMKTQEDYPATEKS